MGVELDAALIAEMMSGISRMEAKLDLCLADKGENHKGTQKNEGGRVLGQLTVKQHAVLQMLLNGKSNAEIAERLGVNENTAKVHVRLIARKLGVSKRQEIVAGLMEPFRQTPEKLYRTMSRGLPKDWDEHWGQGTEKHDHVVTGDKDASGN